MSSYSRNGTNNGASASDRQRGSGYNGQRYIPRDGEDRREDRREDRQQEPVSMNQPSICIPRTFPTIRGEQTKRAVFNTFKDLRIGHIDRIDTVHKTDKNGERFCTVYVHLTWNTRDNLARETRQKLIDGQEIKIVYDEPWFWKCTASTIEKPENRYSDTPQHRNSSRPRIDLGDGNRALSYYTREHDERDHRNEQHEEHNQEQLCNMDPEDDEE